MTIDWALFGDFLLAFALGAMVSSGELIARYRDEPWAAVRSGPGLVYLVINGLASVTALSMARSFGWTFGADPDSASLMQILTAGFGAMAIFRSSFFTVRVDENDIAIGPASFLEVVMDAVDRGVDRQRATLRAERVAQIMKDISFEKAVSALPVFSIALMQNLTNDDQTKMGEDVKQLLESKVVNDPLVKAKVLGLTVMNFLGEGVLKASVNSLRQHIMIETTDSVVTPAAAVVESTVAKEAAQRARELFLKSSETPAPPTDEPPTKEKTDS